MDLYPTEVWKKDVELPFASRGIRFGPSNDLFICDDRLIYKYTESGELEGFAGSGNTKKGAKYDVQREASFSFNNYAYDMCWAPNGDMYLAEATTHEIKLIRGEKVSTYAGATTNGFIDGKLLEARFNTPCDIVYVNDRLIVCDGRNCVLRSIDIATGLVSTISLGSPKLATTPFKFPFGLSLSFNKSQLYIADLDASAIYEFDLETNAFSEFCAVSSPRSVTCLPSGLILANSYSSGIVLCERGVRASKPLDDALLRSGHYDCCIDASTGRLAISGTNTQIFSNVFEPYVDWAPSSLDYVQMRTNTDHFVPDCNLTDSQGNLHPHHSYTLNLFSLLDESASTSSSASTDPKLDWAASKSSELRQIESKFPSLSLEVLLEVLYGSIQTLVDLNGDEFVYRTLEIANALVILGLDPYYLYKLLEFKSRRISVDSLCTYIAHIWKHHPDCRSAANIYAEALRRFPREQWLLEESFGRNSPNLPLATEMYLSSQKLNHIRPQQANCDGLPLQEALWKAALALKAEKGKFAAPVPNSKFVFEINVYGIEGHVVVERWPLYLHWTWLRRLIDAGMSESKTGVAALPEDFPVSLLLYIVGYFYTSFDPKRMTSLLTHVYGSKPLPNAKWPAHLHSSIEFCFNRGGEFGLVDLERHATEELRAPVEKFESLLDAADLLELRISGTLTSPAFDVMSKRQVKHNKKKALEEGLDSVK